MNANQLPVTQAEMLTASLKADDSLPLDENQFSLKQTHAVYDMIYRPAETRLLAAAKKAGCKTANGLGMLLHQGAKAFRIWTSKPAPIAIMRSALESTVHGPKSKVQSRKVNHEQNSKI